ncbi:MAG: hypothetical protein HKP09_07570 [Enterobacterales bacterium]|nr:hypothetical protein [Enterobacterales bacterium]
MYATLKLLAVTALVLIITYVFVGINPSLAILPILPQALVAVTISYYEYKHNKVILEFPAILSHSAIGGYIGSLFGFLTAITLAIQGNIDVGPVEGALQGWWGVISLGILGTVIGAIVHYGNRN